MGARFSAPVQTAPGAHPASCTMGTGSFLGVKSGRGVTLTPHPLLVPLVMKEQSYTSTPPMGRTACTEPQCLYKGDLYLYLYLNHELSGRIWEISHLHHVGDSPWHSLYRGCWKPKADLHALESRNISFPRRKSTPASPVLQSAAKALFGLGYQPANLHFVTDQGIICLQRDH